MEKRGRKPAENKMVSTTIRMHKEDMELVRLAAKLENMSEGEWMRRAIIARCHPKGKIG
jgi:uncharacterized protein (DUF1778 family)